MKFQIEIMLIIILWTLQTCFAGFKETEKTAIMPGVVIARVAPEIGNPFLIQVLSRIKWTQRIESFYQLFPHLSERSFLTDLYEIKFDPAIPPAEMVQALSQTGIFEYVEPKYISKIVTLPFDSLISRQFYLSQIKMFQAWDISRGSPEITIAIVDNGTDYRHPDLLGNIWINEVEKNGVPGVDDDANGYVDDIHGWDFGESDNDPGIGTDPSVLAVHGTHTAGIAAAVTDNITGIAGVGWNCKVMPVKVSTDDDALRTPYGFEGIVYAADNGANIISCSWGHGGEFSQYEQDIIQYAANKGCLIVAAAGNINLELDFYPAGYVHVIAVAAVDENDVKTSYSTFSQFIDIAAPGGDQPVGKPGIFSLFPMERGGYGELSGTSMATPIVAGVLGLLKSRFKDKSPLELTRQVVLTTDNIDALNPDYIGKIGFGRVNGWRALQGEISDEEPVRIKLFDVSFNDSIWGNRNFLFERDEQVSVDVRYRNYAVSPGGNFRLTLRSLDQDINVFHSQVLIESFPPDTILAIRHQLGFIINSQATTHVARLLLDFSVENGQGGSDTVYVPVGKSGVLLVDDDNGRNNVDKFYSHLLDQLQTDYLKWDYQKLSAPPAEFMIHFPMLIWFCEWAFPSLTPKDRFNLQYYLDQGGALFVSGQDIGWDLADSTGTENNQYSPEAVCFYQNYLHSIYLSDNSISSEVSGIPGTIGQNLDFHIYQPGIPFHFQFPDWIEPTEEAAACFRYDNNKGAGVFFAGNHRVVNLGFGFEAMDGSFNDDPLRISEIRKEFMCRVLGRLGPLMHTPLPDKEGITQPVKFSVELSSLVDDPNNISLFYKTNSMPEFEELLLSQTQNQLFEGEVDLTGYVGQVSYYFSLLTPYYHFTLPVNYQDQPFLFNVGKDTVAPQFYHRPLHSLFVQPIQRPVEVYVQDNFKLDPYSVVLHYRTSSEQDSLPMNPIGDNLFEAAIPPLSVSSDTVIYFFSARDSAKVPNRGVSDFYSYRLGLESFEHGLDLWKTDSLGWALDDLEFVSANHSISTYPGQAYKNGADISLQLRYAIPRNQLRRIKLSLWTQYEMEAGKDFGFVEVSLNNGVDWINLNNSVTGIQDEWLQLSFDLSPFYTESEDSLLLRFRFQSDSTQTSPMAGWFLDDLEFVNQGETIVLTDEKEKGSSEKILKVYPSVPNPFNSVTRIRYVIPVDSRASLVIFNSLGQRVLSRSLGMKTAGQYEFVWQGKDQQGQLCSSGIYFFRIKITPMYLSGEEKFSGTIKMVFLR